eukprot:g58569.t1
MRTLFMLKHQAKHKCDLMLTGRFSNPKNGRNRRKAAGKKNTTKSAKYLPPNLPPNIGQNPFFFFSGDDTTPFLTGTSARAEKGKKSRNRDEYNMRRLTQAFGYAEFASLRMPSVRRFATEGGLGQTKKPGHRYPSKEECAAMPRFYHEMDNEVLMLLSARGDPGARSERFIREVMHVDDLEWVEASNAVEKVRKECHLSKVAHLPYKIGVTGAILSAAVSLPMVFHLPTAKWFNEIFVTTDIPAHGELDTPLEIGMWTWGWNEPVMGTLSFVLLCAQFARNQIGNMYASRGDTPYQMLIKNAQVEAALKKYPQYNRSILSDFVSTVTMATETSANAEGRHQAEYAGAAANVI